MDIILKEGELDRLLIINQVKLGKLTQAEAAVSLKLTTRHIRRLLRRIESSGPRGIRTGHRGGNRAFDPRFKEDVLKAVKSRYPDFGTTFASEKLGEEDLHVNKETLRQWMMEAGLWKGQSRKRARIHQSRERRDRFGELVQIDGSHHDWFEGRSPKCWLLVFIDDATSCLVGMRFEASETTLGYMSLVHQHVIRYGRPLAYYSDKHSIFKTTREHCVDGRLEDTQLHRALRSLSIALICAHSPQAKGRLERANKTLQDRLIKEMRLRNISSMEVANAFIPEFIRGHNERFGVAPQNPEDAHRPLVQKPADLKRVLSIQTERKLTKNLEFSHERQTYQIVRKTTGCRLRHIDGSQEVLADSCPLKFKVLPDRQSVQVVDFKEVNLLVDELVADIDRTREKMLPTGSTDQPSYAP